MIDRETYRREWKAYLMRSRLDDLTIAKFMAFEECCSVCLVLYRFEEARVTQKGLFLEIMLLCPECGHRKKVALHSWYERRGKHDGTYDQMEANDGKEVCES